MVLSKGKFRLSRKLSRSWQVSFSSGPDRLCKSGRQKVTRRNILEGNLIYPGEENQTLFSSKACAWSYDGGLGTEAKLFYCQF